MSKGDILVPVVIAIVIFIASQLSVDRDFSDNMKTGATTIFVIVGLIYVLFKIF